MSALSASQKSVAVSGNSPSPNVDVTAMKWLTDASAATSIWLSSVATVAIPVASWKASANDIAASSALPMSVP